MDGMAELRFLRGASRCACDAVRVSVLCNMSNVSTELYWLRLNLTDWRELAWSPEKEPGDNQGPEDHSSEGGPAGTGQAAWQWQLGLQDDWLQGAQGPAACQTSGERLWNQLVRAEGGIAWGIVAKATGRRVVVLHFFTKILSRCYWWKVEVCGERDGTA